ncbi:hypothetical protein [Streptomyces sp. NPDC101181]|uniref:hypothetical protein n=1 Tax=Streptomyces sp. NPDC101181 TaxID=3366125 RepID=UPI00382472D3
MTPQEATPASTPSLGDEDDPTVIPPNSPAAGPVETLDARVEAQAAAVAQARAGTAGQDAAVDAARPADGADDASEHDPCDRPDCTICADPVDGLVHTAATTRSLDEVLALIRLLEQTPEGDEAAGETVRTAAVERPVDDVAELVARLSEPPQPADRADQAIHAAAASRPISDISELMSLLHRPPHDQHAGEEAVHAAATGLTVEELVELIARLRADRAATAPPEPESRTGPADAETARSEHEGPAQEPTAPRTEAGRGAANRPASALGSDPVRPPRAAGTRRPPSDRETPERRRSVPNSPWLRLVSAAVLVLCGVAHFPLHPGDLSTTGLALAAGAAGLGLLLALGMMVRNAVPALAGGVLFGGLLAAAHVIIPKTSSTTLATALHAGGIFATLSAALAGLVCLLVLTIALASARDRAPDPEAAPSTRTAQRDRV